MWLKQVEHWLVLAISSKLIKCCATHLMTYIILDKEINLLIDTIGIHSRSCMMFCNLTLWWKLLYLLFSGISYIKCLFILECHLVSQLNEPNTDTKMLINVHYENVDLYIVHGFWIMILNCHHCQIWGVNSFNNRHHISTAFDLVHLLFKL